MSIRRALLEALQSEQLKDLCSQLEVQPPRRSRGALLDALSSAERATPDRIVAKLTNKQLREALEQQGKSTEGNRDAMVKRLLKGTPYDESALSQSTDVKEGHIEAYLAGTTPRTKRSNTADATAQYRHSDQVVQRPDAGVQDQFLTKKPARTYRYDSSLDPALSWDEKRERDLGEWLLGLITRASKEGEKSVFATPQEWKGGGVRVDSLAAAIRVLKDVSKPFLNWAGKAERHEITVPTVPLFVHERHSTKAILDGIRHRKARGSTLDLFGDQKMDIHENLEAYEHKGPWQNRLILGDSLVVMNSLIEFEGLGGQVQMIYVDPPYGVKFGSNFQPFVRKREVKHGGDDDMTREPEMVRAYRDTWDLGLHSYLTYLRDRLTIARELLHESGSIFVQISEENLALVRLLLNELFGSENECPLIVFKKTGGQSSDLLPSVADYLLWYAKDKTRIKYHKLFFFKEPGEEGAKQYNWIELSNGQRRPMTAEECEAGTVPVAAKIFQPYPLVSMGASATDEAFTWKGQDFYPSPNRHWSVTRAGLERLATTDRLLAQGKTLRFINYLADYPVTPYTNLWTDTQTSGFASDKLYVVQTLPTVIERCMLMCTDPGDLILDPTCGSGTAAYVAEQWGRRWITCDTSRVPLALARQRLLTATFPYYDLRSPPSGPQGGFVYKRRQNRNGDEIGGLVPHITLKSIANDEPPAMEVIVDHPEQLADITRVSGPFVVEATIAPVQPLLGGSDAAKQDGDVSTHIARMTEVLRQSKTLRLPGNRELTLAGVRRTLDTEFIHAEAKEGENRVAIVFGPQDGAVSATLVYEGGREAHYLKYNRLYFFGFAVEPNARSMIDEEKKLRIPAAYVAVTPDVAMSDLLKTTKASEIFSITGLPDFDIRRSKKKGPEGEPLYDIELKGLDIFDPESLETESIGGERVPCWMLDSDYDGLSFYASQVFFPKTSAWDNLQRSLKATFEDSVWAHLAGTRSEPFAIGERRRVAVKVIDERGNELMRVKEVTE
jgi:adenine-specific DNA-methyltransferase